LSGINLTPDTILLDADGSLFASVDPSSVVVRTGYEGEEKRLRGLAAQWVTERYVRSSMRRRIATPARCASATCACSIRRPRP
jgi:hypothetical protein